MPRPRNQEVVVRDLWWMAKMASEQLERKRIAAPERTIRARHVLRDLLADPKVTRVQLEEGVQEFDKRLVTLKYMQRELEV